MADETKAQDDFMAGLKNDSEKDLTQEPADDPFAPVEEKDQAVEEPEVVAEKPLDFHKNPKLQRYIEKEISKRISDTQPAVQEKATDDFKDLVDSMSLIIGNDTPEKVNALNALKNSLSNLDERAAQKALEGIRSERDAELRAEQEADETLMNGFEAIEESTGIDLFASQNKKLKGQFIDFIQKVAPKDEDGEIADFPDIEEAFTIFQSTRAQSTQTQRAKELASRSMERGNSSAPANTQERTNWDWARKQIERLTG